MQAHIYDPVYAPAYLTLLKNGMLAERASAAWGQMEDCDLCARYSHLNCLQSRKGVACRTAEHAVIHSFGSHHGEEDPLRGSRGSGSIFFSWCNLRCSFCQNRGINHKGTGREVELDELAHRVLTENIADTEQVLALVAREISTSTYLNLMEQYHPCYRAWENPPLDRPPRAGEFETAMAIAARDGYIELTGAWATVTRPTACCIRMSSNV